MVCGRQIIPFHRVDSWLMIAIYGSHEKGLIRGIFQDSARKVRFPSTFIFMRFGGRKRLCDPAP